MVHTVFMCISANLEQPIVAWKKIHIRNKNNLIWTVSNCVWLGRQGGMVHANYTTPHPFFSENSETAECIKNSSIFSDICRIVVSIQLCRPFFTLSSLFTACHVGYPFPGALFCIRYKTWKDDTCITQMMIMTILYLRIPETHSLSSWSTNHTDRPGNLWQ